jgi:hypothetical protein
MQNVINYRRNVQKRKEGRSCSTTTATATEKGQEERQKARRNITIRGIFRVSVDRLTY